MASKANPFSFCFALRKLTLVQDSPSPWSNCHSFRVEIYRHQHFVSATPDILSPSNHVSQLVFSKENVTFTLQFADHSVKEMAEVRLYGKNALGQDRLLGCYEFLLNNYVRAYQELSRNYIQLRVQITQDYVIEYDVFVEHTEQALFRLVQEHETAHLLHMADDDISEIESFLPHQISSHQLEDCYKDIRIKEDSPLLHYQRYYSPRRQRPSSHFHTNMEERQKVENTHSTIVSERTRVHQMKGHKATSSSDMAFCLFRMEAEEVASQAEGRVQDRYKAIEQVYRVIESDSKIIQPDELEEHQRPKVIHQTSSKLSKQRQKPFKKMVNLHIMLKFIAISALIITLTALFISSFSASGNQVHIKRRLRKVTYQH